jgi:hypothetical protein
MITFCLLFCYFEWGDMKMILMLIPRRIWEMMLDEKLVPQRNLSPIKARKL